MAHFKFLEHYITFVIKWVNLNNGSFKFLHLLIRFVYGKDAAFACLMLDFIIIHTFKKKSCFSNRCTFAIYANYKVY